MIRVLANPVLLRWACERAGIAQEELTARFKKLPEWEDGKTRSTPKQAEAFAGAVHAPIGYLFLSEPAGGNRTNPGFPNFRRARGHAPQPESSGHNLRLPGTAELVSGLRPRCRRAGLGFVGSAYVSTAPETVAARMTAFAESESGAASYDY